MELMFDVNRHPILASDKPGIVAPIMDGESLGEFLTRTVPKDMGDSWEVIINGQLVPHEVLSNRSIRPKPGTRIVVRGIVNKQALYIVAMIALTYFTFGIGSAGAGAAGAGGAATAGAAAGGYVATTYGVLAASAVYVAGAVIINKLLGPKPEDMRTQERNTVYSLSGSRNQVRLNEPLPIVFGRVKFAPDIISAPYSYYVGNTQRVGVVLTPGANCGRFSPLYMGDTLLTDFDDAVTVYQSGFPVMPDTGIPLYTNANTISGGELNKDQTWVVRNLPPQTQRAMFNIEYILGDADSKGRPYPNAETVEVQYRQVGASTWVPLVSRTYRSNDTAFDTKRATLMVNVSPDGVYETRTRILGNAMDGGGSNGRAQFSLGTIIAVQKDETDYRGIRRIGLDMTATGKLQGTPDEITGVMWADAIPVWKGDAIGWVTEETSNPGAQILAYCRGIFDEKGQIVGGVGVPDDDIDIEALKAFTLHCAANNYHYDFVVRDVRNHEDVINAIALPGFGQLDSKDGRISIVWAAEDQPNEGVANMATMERGSFSVAYDLANEADGIEYTYYDRDSWELKTLRIPFPGVESILSPSRITGEGVGTEEHAAQLARFHAAQQLYQKRDISYSTDLGHMAYRRMSKLSMSHDLTQWGYSGQLVGVSGDVLTLSQTVPPNANGKSYIGVQIPGAANYRVMECVTVGGDESRQVQLVEPWPDDLPRPGAGRFTARDYTWAYDFKATPGHSVRVVSIEPEDDLSGARISVVSEGSEYWQYVKTGEYIPPSNDSLLQTKPVASRLVIGERQNVQGDTVFTELIATFDITGPMGRAIVLMPDENGELQQVAETITRTASWRIPAAGVYTIVVRPFAPDGTPGVAAQATYITKGADVPPVLIDLFEVVERSGGVRNYTWGWLTGTTQSPDFAGVEIRYVAGSVPAPAWESMTPIGADGFHTAPFEAVVPEAGTWTFAARSRNTSGRLSDGMRVITRTLEANLGEQLGLIGDNVAREVSDRIAADAAVANAAALDAQARANAVRDEAFEAIDALGAQVGQALNPPQHDPNAEYPVGSLVTENGRLYSARQNVPVGVAITDNTYWQDIGAYSNVAGLAAAAMSLATANSTEVQAQAQRTDALIARMPAGDGTVAAEAVVIANDQASVNRDGALSNRVGVVEARMPAGDGGVALSASVISLQEAMVNADGALGQRIDTVTATANGASSTATQALTATGQQATLIQQVQQNQTGGGNLVYNPTYELMPLGYSLIFWNNSSGHSVYVADQSDPAVPIGTRALINVGNASAVGGFMLSSLDNAYLVDVEPGKSYIASAYFSGGATGAIQLEFLTPSGSTAGQVASSPSVSSTGGNAISSYARTQTPVVVAPENARRARILFVTTATATGAYFGRWLRPMIEPAAMGQTVASAWAPSVAGIASVTQSLSVGVGTAQNTANGAAAAVNAKYGVYLTNGNLISGFESANNGVTSEFNIRADVFRVVSPTAGERTEYLNGSWRVHDANGVMRVQMGVNI